MLPSAPRSVSAAAPQRLALSLALLQAAGAAPVLAQASLWGLASSAVPSHAGNRWSPSRECLQGEWCVGRACCFDVTCTLNRHISDICMGQNLVITVYLSIIVSDIDRKSDIAYDRVCIFVILNQPGNIDRNTHHFAARLCLSNRS